MFLKAFTDGSSWTLNLGDISEADIYCIYHLAIPENDEKSANLNSLQENNLLVQIVHDANTGNMRRNISAA